MGYSTDEARARAILELMLSADFPGAAEYRSQLKVARLTRHGSGCDITVDPTAARAAPFDPKFPSARLPVEAFGHGKLGIMVHGHAGYLDDLELLGARRFPESETVKIEVG